MRFKRLLASRSLRIMLLMVCFLLPILTVGCSRPAPQPPSEQEVQEFRSALKDGDAAIVDRLLSAKPGLVNVKDETGRTPLADAEARGDDEMLQVLRRHGAKP